MSVVCIVHAFFSSFHTPNMAVLLLRLIDNKQFSTELEWDMMEHVKIYAESKAKIVYVYASDAYGFEAQLWGKPQETVMSHFLTFVNHGCNGTANVGSDVCMNF